MEFIPTSPAEVQEALCDEIEKVLSDMVFTDPQEKNAKMKAYPQSLPKRDEAQMTPAEDEEYTGEGEYQFEDPFPYTVVKIDTGTIADPVVVNTVLIVGIYDSNKKNQGHRTVLNIIQKINERFSKNPTLAGAFRMSEDSFKFAMPEEDSYPYFFGAINMSWQAPAFRREDKFA